MKTHFKTYFLFIFLGLFTLSNAQESKEILELKEKLANNKTDKEKNRTNTELYYTYMTKAKNADSALVYANKVLSFFEKEKDENNIGKMQLAVAEIYLYKSDFVLFNNYLNKGEKNLSASNDYNDKALLNHMKGISLIFDKKNVQASEYFKKNIQYYQDGKNINKHYVMFAYRGLLSNNMVQNKFGESFEAASTYIDFVKKKYPEQLSTAYMILGSFYIGAKEHDKAISSFKKSNQTADTKDQDFINGNYISLGLCYEDSKKLDSAQYYLDKSYAYFKDSNSQNLSKIYYGYALINKQKDNYQLAENYIAKAIKLAPSQGLEATKFTYNIVSGDIQTAKLLSNSGKLINDSYKDSLENLLRKLKEDEISLKESQSMAIPHLIMTNHENLYKINERLGNYEQALFYHKKYVEENDEIYGLDNMRGFSEAQSNYKLQEQKIRIKLQEETKRLQLQKEIELKALRFEYEKKQAAAKSEEERKRLLLEEDLKRKEIELTYNQQKKAAEEKYIQEKQFAKINQEKKDAISKAELESSKLQKNLWAVGAGLSILLLGFAGFSYFQKRKDNRKIAEEKQKSDELLLNILPYEVAEELKEKGKTSAQHYDEVSVLFTDFVNFTSTSERIGVHEMLDELNVCFTAFDNIMGKHGLEKIKTIGDAYLAVCGLPISNPKHAKNTVEAALEILDFIKKRKKENPNALDIRIGIHSGPVIAGIVGVKKFAYDIWGDTVNTAARMEQNSEKGKLNISGSTYSLVIHDFDCEHRGKIETKGKGALDMYFVQPTS